MEVSDDEVEVLSTPPTVNRTGAKQSTVNKRVSYAYSLKFYDLTGVSFT